MKLTSPPGFMFFLDSCIPLCLTSCRCSISCQLIHHLFFNCPISQNLIKINFISIVQNHKNQFTGLSLSVLPGDFYVQTTYKNIQSVTQTWSEISSVIWQFFFFFWVITSDIGVQDVTSISAWVAMVTTHSSVILCAGWFSASQRGSAINHLALQTVKRVALCVVLLVAVWVLLSCSDSLRLSACFSSALFVLLTVTSVYYAEVLSKLRHFIQTLFCDLCIWVSFF